jgi:hypothetical protein
VSSTTNYQYLEPRNGSRFRQLFVKGRGNMRAEVLYRAVRGEDSRTPEEVARDFELPLEAVLEAVDYCTHHEDLLRKERDEELARIRVYEAKHPPVVPPGYRPES